MKSTKNDTANRLFNLEEMQADKLVAAILMSGFVVRAALKDFNRASGAGLRIRSTKRRTKPDLEVWDNVSDA